MSDIRELTIQCGQSVPLRCEIVDGCLVIAVSGDVVKFATENHPAFFDGDQQTVGIENSEVWMRSVVSALNAEGEDGSTRVTRVLDEAIQFAVEQGYEGVKI